MMADDTISYKTRFSSETTLASTDGTSKQKSTETWSVFGDHACGEPLFPQHLVLDFTPNDEDNDIVQKKVISFWQFINNTPEIQNLKVKPDKCEVYEKPSTDYASSRKLKEKLKAHSEENVVNMNKTACSLLEVVDKKDMIKRAFEVKFPQTGCSLGSFKEEDRNQQKKKAHRVPKKTKSSTSAKLLCTELEQWDNKHPRCKDPPGHVSRSLQHCIIQKQVLEF